MTVQPASSDQAPACLFCDRPVGTSSPSCQAFARAGVAAHQACCGCAAWSGWVRSGPAARDLDSLPTERCDGEDGRDKTPAAVRVASFCTP
jgi:hypothetical protein